MVNRWLFVCPNVCYVFLHSFNSNQQITLSSNITTSYDSILSKSMQHFIFSTAIQNIWLLEKQFGFVVHFQASTTWAWHEYSTECHQIQLISYCCWILPLPFPIRPAVKWSINNHEQCWRHSSARTFKSLSASLLAHCSCVDCQNNDLCRNTALRARLGWRVSNTR